MTTGNPVSPLHQAAAYTSKQLERIGVNLSAGELAGAFQVGELEVIQQLVKLVVNSKNPEQFEFWVSYSAMSRNESQATHIGRKGQRETVCGRSISGWTKASVIGCEVCGTCERILGSPTIEMLLSAGGGNG